MRGEPLHTLEECLHEGCIQRRLVNIGDGGNLAHTHPWIEWQFHANILALAVLGVEEQMLPAATRGRCDLAWPAICQDFFEEHHNHQASTIFRRRWRPRAKALQVGT
jgi:hypothetical protein